MRPVASIAAASTAAVQSGAVAAKATPAEGNPGRCAVVCGQQARYDKHHGGRGEERVQQAGLQQHGSSTGSSMRERIRYVA